MSAPASPFHVRSHRQSSVPEPYASSPGSARGKKTRAAAASPSPVRRSSVLGLGSDLVSGKENASAAAGGQASARGARAKARPASAAKQQQAEKARDKMASMLSSDHLYNVAEARLQAAEAVHTEQLQLLQAQSRERESEANEMRRFETERADSLASILSEVEDEMREKDKARALEIQQLVSRLDEAGCQAREARRAAEKAIAERDAIERERNSLADELRACQRKLEQAAASGSAEVARRPPESTTLDGVTTTRGVATPAEIRQPGIALEVAVPQSPAPTAPSPASTDPPSAAPTCHVAAESDEADEAGRVRVASL